MGQTLLTPWWQCGESSTDANCNIIWQKAPIQTECVSQLLSLPVINGINGIQKINLTKCINCTSSDDARLVTRAGMRAVYDCIADDIIGGAVGHTFLVEGAPGTSKSRNLLYLLKRLLFANRLVIFDCGALEILYIFVPPEGELNSVRAEDDNTQNRSRYQVYRVPNTKSNRISCAAVQFNHAVYIFDPSLAVSSHEPALMTCNVVIAASPNDKHYKQSIQKRHFKKYITNPFTLEEVLGFFAALPPAPAREFSDISVPTPLSEGELRNAFFYVSFCVVPSAIFYLFSLIYLFCAGGWVRSCVDIRRVDRQSQIGYSYCNPGARSYEACLACDISAPPAPHPPA